MNAAHIVGRKLNRMGRISRRIEEVKETVKDAGKSALEQLTRLRRRGKELRGELSEI